MSATAEQIAELRRMAADPAPGTYSDEELAAKIEEYPLVDRYGRTSEDVDWTEDYDLNPAAADVWGWKAAALQGEYDFTADGGTFNRNQAFEQAQKMQRYFRSRRKPTTVRLHMASPYTRGGGADDVDDEDLRARLDFEYREPES